MIAAMWVLQVGSGVMSLVNPMLAVIDLRWFPLLVYIGSRYWFTLLVTFALVHIGLRYWFALVRVNLHWCALLCDGLH